MIPATIRGRAVGVAARSVIAGAVSVIGGLAVALLDSQPHYDDTGVTAVLLIGIAAVAAAIGARRPWLWAVLVGVWTPLVEISAGGSTGSLLALGFAAAGAAIGFGIHRAMRAEPG